MAAVLALLPYVLQYLPTIEVGVEHLISWIASVRSAAQQTGEWTPELEAQFLQALIATKTDPAYQPDPAAVIALPQTMAPPMASPAPQASGQTPAPTFAPIPPSKLTPAQQAQAEAAVFATPSQTASGAPGGTVVPKPAVKPPPVVPLEPVD